MRLTHLIPSVWPMTLSRLSRHASYGEHVTGCRCGQLPLERLFERAHCLSIMGTLWGHDSTNAYKTVRNSETGGTAIAS